ncbi:MAG: MerR family transcriptional regulator [Gemmatimonadetes bacterium]|jgi:DNA-binding transcriptional MerR regulator|nr:MerR family transcriptional regulator [Gemmatimonadota bacterium]
MMQIGDLAARAGITTRTIRYYEELGIIEPDERTEGGFRLYSELQLRRLNIVQGLKALGFDLERIRSLFDLKHTADTGGELAAAMSQHLYEQQREIDEKINHYLAMKERNLRAIDVLRGCMNCDIKVLDRSCHECEVYKQHPEVPDMIECSMYELST